MACLTCALAYTSLYLACRQAQDKLSDVAAQAQVRAQELAHDVSTLKSVHLAAARCLPNKMHVCLKGKVAMGPRKETALLLNGEGQHTATDKFW